jgi:hypothetical protein
MTKSRTPGMALKTGFGCDPLTQAPSPQACMIPAAAGGR